MKHQTTVAALPLFQPGDRIRLIAPSGPVPAERFAQGVACLREWELEPVYEPEILSRETYLAGSDARRLAELQAALADHDARAIWGARGGYGAARLLSGVTPAQVGKQVLLGFSDLSALHALWHRAGRGSVHACNLSGLGEWEAADRLALYEGLFRGSWPSLQGQTALGRGCVQGPIMGGNLTVFAALAGTGFLPDLRGAIVFLEDVAERPYRLDRSLTQLLQTGVLQDVAAVAIGQLTKCEDPPGKEQGRSALDVMVDVLAPLNVPILTGLRIGHERSALPLPFGVDMVLDADAGVLRCAAAA